MARGDNVRDNGKSSLFHARQWRCMRGNLIRRSVSSDTISPSIIQATSVHASRLPCIEVGGISYTFHTHFMTLSKGHSFRGFSVVNYLPPVFLTASHLCGSRLANGFFPWRTSSAVFLPSALLNLRFSVLVIFQNECLPPRPCCTKPTS